MRPYMNLRQVADQGYWRFRPKIWEMLPDINLIFDNGGTIKEASEMTGASYISCQLARMAYDGVIRAELFEQANTDHSNQTTAGPTGSKN